MNARGRLELTGALHWSTQTCLILGGDTGDSLMRTWWSEILDVFFKKERGKNNMSFSNISSTTHGNPVKATCLDPKPRADAKSHVTASARRRLHPCHPHRSQSSLTIMTAPPPACTKRGFQMCHREGGLFPLRLNSNAKKNETRVSHEESVPPYRRMPQSCNALGTIPQQWTECTINE